MNDAEISESRRHVQRAQQAITTRRWGDATQAVEGRTVIELYAEPRYDDFGTMTVGEWGGWYVQIMPMIYNDRVVLTPKTATDVYDHGWCFPKGVAAMLAVLVWDPDTDGEPHGYIKRVGARRNPGDTATG